MSSSPEARNLSTDGAASTVTHVSLHSADPGETGADEVTRAAGTYAAASSGSADLASAVVLDVSGGVTVTHWGAWDDTTFLFGEALSESQPFATDGTYTLSSAPWSAG